MIRMLSPFVWIIGVMLLVGCSTGLKEVAFQQNDGSYVVSQSLVNDRVTASQPHAQKLLLCKQKISSIQMSILRSEYGSSIQRSWYGDCVTLIDYAFTSDQPVATLYKGPMEAAIIAGGIGAGLAMSGDTITQNGGGSNTSIGATFSQSSNAARGGKRGHGKR